MPIAASLFSEPSCPESLDFFVAVAAFVKREPSSQLNGFSRRAAGEFWVAVQTWASFVEPDSVQWLPRGNDPAVAGLGTADGERFLFDLVFVGLPVEAGSGLQHDAVLNSQICQQLLRTVFQCQLHRDVRFR